MSLGKQFHFIFINFFVFEFKIAYLQYENNYKIKLLLLSEFL